MPTARKLPTAKQIISAYTLDDGGRGKYARVARHFVALGYQCSDQHVINTMRKHQEQQQTPAEIQYEPCPGEDEVERQRVRFANEALLRSLLLPTTCQNMPTEAAQCLQGESEPLIAHAQPLPMPKHVANGTCAVLLAEARWCADLSLLVLLFALVVVFVAALKDGWLALALTVPCGGIFHLAWEAQGIYAHHKGPQGQRSTAAGADST